MSRPIATHARICTSVTAAAEKRLLVWIAARLPLWVTSDALSALGLLAMAAAGASFAAFRWSPWAAAAVVVSLAANWFGDSLDGTVARVRRQERPRFGYYVDHVVDLAGAAMLIAGLAVSGLMLPAIAAAVLAAYLLVSAESYLTTHARCAGARRATGCSCAQSDPDGLKISATLWAIASSRRTINHTPTAPRHCGRSLVLETTKRFSAIAATPAGSSDAAA